MKASIITIGDEILIGQVTDTNAAWIARALSDMGFAIAAKFTVGDNAVQITDALDRALLLSDAVIITGGLGPTRDDMTKKVLAGYFGMALKEDAAVLADIEAMLSRRGLPLNELNRSQALVPDGCTVLPNANGTAPGMWFDRAGNVVVSLPGVPFEMKALMENEVVPRLAHRFPRGNTVHRTVHTSGIAESVLAERIAHWENTLGNIKLAYLPSTAGVRLRLSSYEMPADQAADRINQKIAELKTIIGDYLLEEGESDPAEALARMLTAAGQTLSVAESCTGGRIATMITARAGASAWFTGGVVAYTPGVKTAVLGVPAQTIEKYGVVSAETALAMAQGVRRLTGSSYAVSTTGVAGPDSGGSDEPVGTVWIGIAGPDGSHARKVRFGRLREPNIERASYTALNLLRLYLIGDKDAPVAGGIF